MTRSITTHRVADGVTFVEGPASNWVVLVGQGSVGLIDTGYPGDVDLVEQSISRAGGAGLPLATILLTHGHSDHSGSAAELVRRHGSTVLAAAEEIPNIRREVTEQVTVARLLPHLWRPRALRWALHALRAGGLSDVAVPVAGAFPEPQLRVAGFTVIPLATPGHTAGHSAYLIPAAEALVTGDALVSAHPLSGSRGPQLLPEVFHGDVLRAHSSLSELGRQFARTILPGHGPLIRDHPAFAVSAARGRLIGRMDGVPDADAARHAGALGLMLGWSMTVPR